PDLQPTVRAESPEVVIIGGVILFATLITLLLLHHMKKKDEGSYSLTSSAYQRAPSREFYA
uniref:Syndecan/Neurexin domain-containing protein n=1 Tax=Denticeps clupeoides TaxID=299321 RepID=A0AAY4CLW5_9TELE